MSQRYVVLAASVLIQLCLGSVYAWSTFVPALRASYGLSAGRAGLLFGVTIAVFTLTMVWAGRLQETYGPRRVAAVGGLCFGLGYLLASLSAGQFVLILLGIGLMAGAGIGLGYVCPLATCIKWFPEAKGLVTGIAVAGFGGGAILLSEVAEELLSQGWDVLMVFRGIGVVYGAVIVSAAQGLAVPEMPAAGRAGRRATGLREALGERAFWYLAAGMFAGTFGGLLVIGNLKSIGLAAGLESAAAATAVSIFAAGNASGRILWGWVHDRIGRPAIPLSLALLGGGIVALGFAGTSATVWTAAILVGFGFGACFVLYAAEVAALYGPHRVGLIYPGVFLAYGISGLAGPALAGWIYDAGGSYVPGIGIAAVLAFAAAAGTWFFGKSLQKLPSSAASPREPSRRSKP
ncbi:MAG: MFS transporter [Candidatus Sumerlaeia bacterium]|nr:MFS transporter [Candidatus Sumerlaeia bacterium]